MGGSELRVEIADLRSDLQEWIEDQSRDRDFQFKDFRRLEEQVDELRRTVHAMTRGQV
jgi:hypothetical protein